MFDCRKMKFRNIIVVTEQDRTLGGGCAPVVLGSFFEKLLSNQHNETFLRGNQQKKILNT